MSGPNFRFALAVQLSALCRFRSPAFPSMGSACPNPLAPTGFRSLTRGLALINDRHPSQVNHPKFVPKQYAQPFETVPQPFAAQNA
jgi:hypothetical protein